MLRERKTSQLEGMPPVTAITQQTWPLERLIDYARNPRKNDHAVDRVAAAIKEFGFRVPIVAKSDGLVVDGHLRLKAARKLGLAEVPVVLADDLTDAQVKAFRISVNRMAELAEWDSELLALELGELGELGFDLELTGFDGDEINALTPEVLPEGKTDPDEAPEPPAKPRSALGDVWILGKHRVMCGDSTSLDEVERLMAGAKADIMFTDPPYGVNYTDSLGRSIKNDELTDGDLQDFLRDAFVSGVRVCASDCPWYVWHADRFTTEFVAALKEAGLRVRQQIIWVKGEGREGTAEVAAPAIGGAHYRFLHEPCWYASLGTPFNAGDRKTTTVWTVSRPTTGTVHPTQKPIPLIEIALENSAKKKAMVLDLFGGSGSTLIACEKTGRIARLMELDPRYVDVIVKRWQDFTGKQAKREADGKLFDEVT